MTMFSNDFRQILLEAGKNLTLRKVSFGEDPIYGEGTASYTDSTVTGFIDTYDVGRELLGLGDLGIGQSRVFLESIATPNVNDLIVDNSTTYKINRVETFRFSSEDVYIACDLSKEGG